jgi:Flp pilus assembly pilin Flp
MHDVADDAQILAERRRVRLPLRLRRSGRLRQHRHRAGGREPMLHLVKRFTNDDSGKTSIEYVLIAIGIAIGIIMVVTSLGSLVPHR